MGTIWAGSPGGLAAAGAGGPGSPSPTRLAWLPPTPQVSRAARGGRGGLAGLQGWAGGFPLWALVRPGSFPNAGHLAPQPWPPRPTLPAASCSGPFLPRGLCTGCAPCDFVTAFQPHLKSHLLREALPACTVSFRIPPQHAHLASSPKRSSHFLIVTVPQLSSRPHTESSPWNRALMATIAADGCLGWPTRPQ